MANWIKSFLEQNPNKASWPVFKRAKHSLHLQRPDGQIEATFTGAPCHFQDILGEWHELDTKLIAIGSEYGAPGLQTRLKTDGTVRIEGGTYSHRSTRVGIFNATTKAFTAVKTIPLGTVQDDKIIAGNDIWQRVLTLTETGLREEIIIQSLPANLPSQADRWVVLETEVSGMTFPDGWLDEFEAESFRFPLPRAYDANRDAAECKRYARTVGGVQYIYTGVPVSWLASAVYPVTIDPDYAGDTADGYIAGGNTTTYLDTRTSYASSITTPEGAVGQDFSATKYYAYRTFLKFVTSAIPDDAEITQVYLKLVCNYDYSGTDFIVEIVEQDWSAQDPITADTREAAFDGCLAPTNHFHWRSTNGMSVNTQYNSDNLTIAYVSKTGNTYYSLRSDEDKADSVPTGVEYCWIVNQNHTTAAYRPILTVVYTTTAIKTILGLPLASVKTVNGLAIANVKTFNGLA